MPLLPFATRARDALLTARGQQLSTAYCSIQSWLTPRHVQNHSAVGESYSQTRTMCAERQVLSSMNLFTSKDPPSQHIKFDDPCLPQKYFRQTLCLTFSNLRVTWGTNRFNSQQDSQCTYNVTPRSGRTTIVAVEKQWVLHNLSYPACNAHAPYCHLWPAPLYNVYFFCSHFLINSMIFERGYWTQNACFDFLYNFYLKHFLF